ncbi:hypothetical protein BUE93_09130 [Chromobacterium amazonense]|uniref:Salmonella invasion protein A N-terminal domain-containing protein n=1 Tax=Chromobacterium amazonense TaxID=1382803 RepID=A0A2S9X5L9_9NEIS|nr:hypothetical protein [Chromobacterium amazonense]PRP70976.1 hypothetical protein BUE93_09130 [Chromobacterium amazonense]
MPPNILGSVDIRLASLNPHPSNYVKKTQLSSQLAGARNGTSSLAGSQQANQDIVNFHKQQVLNARAKLFAAEPEQGKRQKLEEIVNGSKNPAAQRAVKNFATVYEHLLEKTQKNLAAKAVLTKIAQEYIGHILKDGLGEKSAFGPWMDSTSASHGKLAKLETKLVDFAKQHSTNNFLELGSHYCSSKVLPFIETNIKERGLEPPARDELFGLVDASAKTAFDALRQALDEQASARGCSLSKLARDMDIVNVLPLLLRNVLAGLPKGTIPQTDATPDGNGEGEVDGARGQGPAQAAAMQPSNPASTINNFYGNVYLGNVDMSQDRTKTTTTTTTTTTTRGDSTRRLGDAVLRAGAAELNRAAMSSEQGTQTEPLGSEVSSRGGSTLERNNPQIHFKSMLGTSQAAWEASNRDVASEASSRGDNGQQESADRTKAVAQPWPTVPPADQLLTTVSGQRHSNPSLVSKNRTNGFGAHGGPHSSQASNRQVASEASSRGDNGQQESADRTKAVAQPWPTVPPADQLLTTVSGQRHSNPSLVSKNRTNGFGAHGGPHSSQASNRQVASGAFSRGDNGQQESVTQVQSTGEALLAELYNTVSQISEDAVTRRDRGNKLRRTFMQSQLGPDVNGTGE